MTTLARRDEPMHGRTFELYRGTELLGTIELRAELCDFPWYGGRFKAESAYAAVKHLFEAELRLLDQEDMDAWGEVWQRIATPSLRLVPARGGEPVADLMIHIDGDEARWRS